MKTLKHSLVLAASIFLFTALFPLVVSAATLVANEPATIYYTTNGNDPTYSIYVRPQGQIANSYPITYQSKVWQPPCYYINSPLAECRSELWKDSLGTATFDEIILGFPAFKPSMITQVEQIRATALARSTTTNTGVMAVWEQNYQAAVARLNGLQDVTIMKNGMMAEEYLTGLGSQIGMNSLQFAQYVINESVNLAPKAYEIEKEYLRLKYQVIPNTTSALTLLTIPIDYQTFCAP